MPKGPRGSIPEGTLATSWVLANYGRLTPRRAPGRRSRAEARLRPLGWGGGSRGAARCRQGPGHRLRRSARRRGAHAAGHHRARLPVERQGRRGARRRRAAAATVDQARGALHHQRQGGGASKTVIAHEVFHCLQIQLTGSASGLQSLDGDRAWLGEGSASYAGCLFSQDGAAPYKQAPTPATSSSRPRRSTHAPTTPWGFFAHLDQSRRGRPGQREERHRRSVDGGRVPGARERGRQRHLRLLGLEPLPDPGARHRVGRERACVPRARTPPTRRRSSLRQGAGSRSRPRPTRRIPTSSSPATPPAARSHPPRERSACAWRQRPRRPADHDDTVFCLAGGSGRSTPRSR